MVYKIKSVRKKLLIIDRAVNYICAEASFSIKLQASRTPLLGHVTLIFYSTFAHVHFFFFFFTQHSSSDFLMKKPGVITHAKIFRKTITSYTIIRTHRCADPGVKYVSFSENSGYVGNKWPLTHEVFFESSLKVFSSNRYFDFFLFF